MAQKTIYMISGNKGGVGKSLFCLALASAFDMRGEHYAIFDGDGRTGDVFAAFSQKIPARWGDFRMLRPESHNCDLDGEYEMTLHKLLRGSPNLIVNTPDGADSILAKWFDVTLAHTESNNYQFKLIYLLSDRPDGLDMIDELAKRFQFMYPVRNMYFGGEQLFAAFNTGYAKKFNAVIEFPRLRGEEVRMLFDLKTYPFEILNLKRRPENTFTAPAIARARILKWQKLVYDNIVDMIENTDVSNFSLRGSNGS